MTSSLSILALYLVALLPLTWANGDATPTFDPYEVLGVHPSSSQSEIRRAYKKLALEYHPDKNVGEDTTDKFSLINSAYDILGNPDKRAVYDDFGKSSSGHTGFYSYWEFQQSNTKSDGDFYLGDPFITRLTASLWDQRIVGNNVWLVVFYAPWCVHCQNSVHTYKAVAGRLDEVVEVGAFNCHKDNAFCQEFGVSAYPSYYLLHPGMGFQLHMPLHGGDLATQIEEFAQSKSAEWKRLATQSALLNLNATNFEEAVLESEDFWLVTFIGGNRASKSKIDSARMNLVRLSANLRGLAGVAIFDCSADGENRQFCEKEFPGKSLSPDVFPIFKGYSRGATNTENGYKKSSEELFPYEGTPVHVACEVIEKMVQLMMAHERICKNGECSALVPNFAEGYEEYTEDEEEEEKQPRREAYQDSGMGRMKQRQVDGRRRNPALGRG